MKRMYFNWNYYFVNLIILGEYKLMHSRFHYFFELVETCFFTECFGLDFSSFCKIYLRECTYLKCKLSLVQRPRISIFDPPPPLGG